MAYACIIASVSPHVVKKIRVPADVHRVTSRVAYVSHFIAPLNAELREAMDGGTPLATDTWHPLRNFMWHEPPSVQKLVSRLEKAAAQMRAADQVRDEDEWILTEITKLTELFRHASANHEAVVTYLDLTRTGAKRA